MRSSHAAIPLVWLGALALPGYAADGNRLTYLDGNDPYYVSRTFPKLITPQWVGEPGVEAVVVLAIDDMRDPKKYEQFLRPILGRLKQIDGRAPVSIMTNQVDPKDPQLQAWLKEGLSLETHTMDHPCPLLQKGDFGRARSTYERCVDLLAEVPNSRPVAYRMPCCDSLNTVSPRFFTEIFNRTTPAGHFLTLDSSVFNVFTSNDPDLPREWVIDADGRDKFRKYVPYDRSFVNTIEDYPYPYVIGRLCWEFPCVVPSDWEADHLHKAANPLTVRDWKAALDATVRKQGTFNLVFHPHGWIKSEQIVELIDYAVGKYGKKVKFLTFREAQERLNQNLLGGVPLRNPETGGDNGVRILDLDNDGFVDVVIGNDKVHQTRRWAPDTRSWVVGDFPAPLVPARSAGKEAAAQGRFGVLQADGKASLLLHTEQGAGGWHFDGAAWRAAPELLNGLEVHGVPIQTAANGVDQGMRLRDLDGDGRCELIVANPQQRAILAWSPEKKTWALLPFTLPAGAAVVDREGRDAGLRFIDVDEDGFADVLISNEKEYGLYLFKSSPPSWI